MKMPSRRELPCGVSRRAYSTRWFNSQLQPVEVTLTKETTWSRGSFYYTVRVLVPTDDLDRTVMIDGKTFHFYTMSCTPEEKFFKRYEDAVLARYGSAQRALALAKKHADEALKRLADAALHCTCAKRGVKLTIKRSMNLRLRACGLNTRNHADGRLFYTFSESTFDRVDFIFSKSLIGKGFNFEAKKVKVLKKFPYTSEGLKDMTVWSEQFSNLF